MLTYPEFGKEFCTESVQMVTDVFSTEYTPEVCKKFLVSELLVANNNSMSILY